MPDAKPRLDYAPPPQGVDTRRVAYTGFLVILIPIAVALFLGGLVLLFGILRSLTIGS